MSSWPPPCPGCPSIRRKRRDASSNDRVKRSESVSLSAKRAARGPCPIAEQVSPKDREKGRLIFCRIRLRNPAACAVLPRSCLVGKRNVPRLWTLFFLSLSVAYGTLPSPLPATPLQRGFFSKLLLETSNANRLHSVLMLVQKHVPRPSGVRRIIWILRTF